MTPNFTPTLPPRRQQLRDFVVDLADFIARLTTYDEVELRERLVNVCGQLIVAAALADATDSAKGDPGWQAALPSQKDAP